MSVWIARDKFGSLWVYENKPLYEPMQGEWVPAYDGERDFDCFDINPDDYPEIEFENSPMRLIPESKVADVIDDIIAEVKNRCNIRQVLEYLNTLKENGAIPRYHQNKAK